MQKLDLSHPQNPLEQHEDTPTEAVAKETIKQKASLWVFIVIALLTLILGSASIYKQLTGPFQPQLKNSNQSAVVLGKSELEKLQELKTKDTDSDTLNDYDELYVYDTSPYLADSDSDNASDAEELKEGQNPNCPQGTICDQPRKSDTPATNSGVTPPSAPSNTITPSIPTNAAPATNTGTANQTADTGQNQPSITADIIRQTLKNAGAPAESVDAMSDEALLTLYEETVKETGYSGTTTPVNSASDDFVPDEVENAYSDLLVDTESPYGALGEVSAETLEQLKNLPPEEIRKLLIQLGGEETFIQTIDDATLQFIFLQAIEEIIQSQSKPSTSANANTNSGSVNTNQK
ncbi:MAG: hypothetical protein A3B74_02070 [Candidatus Kerfeldbacteria bacterium RIFCSPHIGHO2_02_FULL_42_14]|uniref:Uncharacterized protein n=1 Tax=Candidatus Kerfeldbacteria bacterium RIFCSPHIGHO2_02_FULL_42_14 TaxID=1798540 RepID=A0A1G2ANJ0_9BACT|nr:MAG: hypothetical protein A3B74_02070 [Candidatus Kerfeldbacteria bacterium RIFCSPHIGHO2_02_FULL_42_14]OGY81803.1 MAG: hypothetical protein A3E60_00645 [Candidatus Kerfeldbacteria bacterium RIFCSPHIGHO2_12_FULL_42_13]OGY84492.1 MAG: hypothetical protein A3I91_00260 [Candidatus Kerfeldbacteria bacterium RIFCSPLOWO2_02_FULL_42_19]OGY87968.1 MAG: hypothetical protein A3G01_04070 [Candidatus Kerfeldbacteria bacterium RIFCSPLOWO2_12_FULL_43_9]